MMVEPAHTVLDEGLRENVIHDDALLLRSAGAVHSGTAMKRKRSPVDQCIVPVGERGGPDRENRRCVVRLLWSSSVSWKMSVLWCARGSLSNSKVSVAIQGEVGPRVESPPRSSGAVMVNGSFCSAKAVAVSQTMRHTTASTSIFWFSQGALAGRP